MAKTLKREQWPLSHQPTSTLSNHPNLQHHYHHTLTLSASSQHGCTVHVVVEWLGDRRWWVASRLECNNALRLSSFVTPRRRPFELLYCVRVCSLLHTVSSLFPLTMENDGIQRLLKAEDDAAQVIQKAREGQHAHPDRAHRRIAQHCEPKCRN